MYTIGLLGYGDRELPLDDFIGFYFVVTLICLIGYFVGARKIKRWVDADDESGRRQAKILLLRWCVGGWFLPMLCIAVTWLANILILSILYGFGPVWSGDIYFLPTEREGVFKISNGDVYTGWQFTIWTFSQGLFFIAPIVLTYCYLTFFRGYKRYL